MIDIQQWMELNVETLANAIATDKRIGGPSSDALLTEAQQCDASGHKKSNARKLLIKALHARGIGYLLAED